MLPSISVAMAMLNGTTFLQDQLNSLAAQTYFPDALWITDDGSTDATQTIVNTFAAKAPFRVHFVKHHKRLGYRDNFLKAANLAGGDFVAFCDQDDVWLPSKLERIARTAKEFAPGLIVHSGRVVEQSLDDLGHRFPNIEETTVNKSNLKTSQTFYPAFTLVVDRRLVQLLGAKRFAVPFNICPCSMAMQCCTGHDHMRGFVRRVGFVSSAC